MVDDDNSDSINEQELQTYITDGNKLDMESLRKKKKAYEKKMKQTEKISRDLGGSLMKFKILIGYSQCMTFLPVVLTTAVAMFEIIGKGDVNLNVGDVTCVGSGERIGLIGGITGIPGTYNYSLLMCIRPFSYIFCDIKLFLIFDATWLPIGHSKKFIFDVVIL